MGKWRVSCWVYACLVSFASTLLFEKQMEVIWEKEDVTGRAWPDFTQKHKPCREDKICALKDLALKCKAFFHIDATNEELISQRVLLLTAGHYMKFQKINEYGTNLYCLCQ